MGASAWLCRPPASPPSASVDERCAARLLPRLSWYTAALLLIFILVAGGPVLAEPPAAPTGLEVETADGKVTFNWNNPHDSTISHYQFQYKRSDRLWSAWADMDKSDATTTTLTARGLVNGKSYRFRIRAVRGMTTRMLLINGARNDSYFPVEVREQGTIYVDLGEQALNGSPIARYLSTNGSPPPLTSAQYNSLDKWQYRFTTPRTIANGYIQSWHPWQTPWVDMGRGSGTCGQGKDRICFRLQGLTPDTWHLFQFRMVFDAQHGPAVEARDIVPGDPPLTLSIAGLNRPFTPADFDSDYARRAYRMLVFTFSERVERFTEDDIDVECAIKETAVNGPIVIPTRDGDKFIYRLSIKPTICQQDNPKVKVTVKASSVSYQGSENGTVVTKMGPEHTVTAAADCPVCAPQAPVEHTAASEPTPIACPATDASLVQTVRGYHRHNSKRLDYNHNWHRVLIAFGAETHPTFTPYTAAEARRGETRWGGWRPVRQELERLEACSRATAEAQRVAADPKPLPTLIVRDTTAPEGSKMTFPVVLSEPSTEPVCFDAYTRDSTPVSATERHDYWPMRWDTPGERLCIGPGDTQKSLLLHILNDTHDDPDETFELVIANATGAIIADGVGVGTITNDDPLPAAFLARFGRTVAEQALDGIAGRMAADRTPGMQGTLAGQALSFDPVSGQPATGGADDDAELAMTGIARVFGAAASAPSGDRFGALDTSPPQSRTMGGREALLGSSFALTGERDGSGGTMAFWGRASQNSFDGAERSDGTDIALDGTVTTAMLGADYARGDWLVGLALTQSTSDGKYASIGEDSPCSEAGDEARVLCDGAVRAGDGKVEAQLAAVIPYASLQASERLKLWGAVGYGTGEVTLKTAMGGNYSADTSWSMAAAGLRSDVIAPPAVGSGPALAMVSDALWARTSSETTRDLAASESDVTRLRFGLEGSWAVALGDGGGPRSGSGASLTPKLEIGARHDGGDAETGFGVELGGGIAWTDPIMGLSLDLSGRTLLAHDNDDLKDQGVSATLTFDPTPETKRGLSLSLRQDFGGQAEGGLDALFAPDLLEDRTDSEAESRWAMEAAWGLPAFGRRWTGSPHAGLGLATGARDYSLGWRLTPEAPNAPDLSFGVKAARRESGASAPEHTLGFEINTRW